MALDNRSPSSALFKRAEQLRRWQESETNRVEIYDKPRKVNFSDGCIFLAACAAGDKNEVLRLLEKGADIDTANVDGLTALHAACIDDNLDMVEFLVDQGADVNRGDMEGWTPLHATASCGFNSIAQFLIDRGADLALVNNDGDLCIDIADSEEMEGLLQNEVDTRGIDCEASRNEEERRMREDAQRWLTTGYCADRPHPKTGASALHVAAAKGYHKVMNILLEAGADINSQDFDGWTPLHAAAHWGQREAVEILCENESDMEVRNYVGQSSFDVADNGLIKLLDELKRKQASRRLIVNRKRKTSPNRDSRKKKEKEDQHDSDGTSSDESTSDVEKKNKVNKENVAQIIPTTTPERNNGRSPITTPNKTTDSMDESEVQSWRRPSSLRNKTSPPDDRNRQDEVTRTISSPARISSSREEEALQRTSASPEKDERNHVDSMTRVSIGDPTTGVLNTSISPPARSVGSNATPQTANGGGLTPTIIPPPPKSAPALVIPPPRPPAPTTTSPSTPIAPAPSPATSQTPDSPMADQQLPSSPVTPPSAGMPGQPPTPSKGISPGSVIKNFFKSFVPPSRDEESETQRKAHAKMVRSTRRSTQGVTLEDLKSAEQLMKNKKQEQFTLESVARSKENENEVDAVAAPLRKKSTDVGDEDKESERTSQTREGTQAVLQRRKKPKRRSTGRVQVNMDEIDPEKRAARLAEQQQKAAAGEEVSDDDEEEEDSIELGKTNNSSPHGTPDSSDHSYVSDTDHIVQEEWKGMELRMSHESLLYKSHISWSPPCSPKHKSPAPRSPTPPAQDWYFRRSTSPPDCDNTRSRNLRRHSRRSCTPPDREILGRRSLTPTDVYLNSETLTNITAIESNITNLEKESIKRLQETCESEMDNNVGKDDSLEISMLNDQNSIEISVKENTTVDVISFQNLDIKEKLKSIETSIECIDDIDNSSLIDKGSTVEISPLENNEYSVKADKHSMKHIDENSMQESENFHNLSKNHSISEMVPEITVKGDIKDKPFREFNCKESSPPRNNYIESHNDNSISNSSLTKELDLSIKELAVPPEPSGDNISCQEIEETAMLDKARVTKDVEPVVETQKLVNLSEILIISDNDPEEKSLPAEDEFRLMPPVFTETKFLTPSPERGAASVYSTPWESPATTPERECVVPPVFSVPFRTPTTSPDREGTLMPPVYSAELMTPVYASSFPSPTTSPDRDESEMQPVYSSIFISPATSPDRDIYSLPAVYSSVFTSPATSPAREFQYPIKSPNTDSLIAQLMPPVFSTPWRSPATSPERDIALMPPVFSKNFRYASPDKDDIKLVQEILMRPVYSQTWRPTLSPSPSPSRVIPPEVVLDSPVDDKLLCPPIFSSPFRSPAPSPDRAWKSVTPTPERYFDSETDFPPTKEPINSPKPPQPVYYTAGTAWSEESTTSPERGLILSSDQSLSERGEGTKAASNGNSRTTSRSTSLGPENGEPDYKKLYEEQLAENAKILDRLRITETELQTTRETIEANNKKNNTEKREKRALERKLSEMEEELKLLEHLKQENQKLKDENGALIRVISKLSK